MRAPVRWAAALAAAAMLAGGMATPPAAAAVPDTLPVVTAPAAGATATGIVTIDVQSSAPRVQVLLQVPSGAAPRRTFTLGAVDVVAGSATLPWTTWGYPNGPADLEVRDCDTSCSGVGTFVPVVLENSAPTFTSPLPYSTLSGVITATAEAAGGAVQFDVEPRYGSAVIDQEAPYAARFDVADFPDGAKHLVVTRCAGSTCDGPSTAIPVTFVSLHPRISSTPHTFSPNGDGVRDRITATLVLERAQTVTWEVRRRQTGTGTLVRSAASLGRLAAGTYRFSWGGRGNGGALVADGQYAIVVRTSEGWRRGRAVTGFNVDKTPPTVAYVSGAGSTFYPYVDGFKDRFTPKVGTGDAGPGYDVELTIARTDGTIVRRRDVISWNGRYASGAAVPAGRYRWRVTAVDRGGNVARTPWYDVTVSWRRTEDVTYTLTVPASAGTVTADAGCAAAASSAFPSGLALTNSCAAGVDLVAVVADYTLTVPPAAAYTSVAVRLDVGSASGPGLVAGVVASSGSRRFSLPQSAIPTGWWTGYQVSPAGTSISASRQVRLFFMLRNVDVASAADIRQVRVVVTAKVFV